jgi:nicotinamidase-related amidase
MHCLSIQSIIGATENRALYERRMGVDIGEAMPIVAALETSARPSRCGKTTRKPAMPATTLDLNTALIVIDLQKGIVGLPTVHPTSEVVARAARLAEAFRRRGLPVVLVNVAGVAPGRTEQPRPAGAFPDGWAELVPELNRQPQDHLVTKRTWGAFANTDLLDRLRREGVTQVVIAGIATSIGVESTARQAYESGFNVTLATDAMTDRQAEAHENSIERIFPRLGETATTDEILALLDKAGR